MKKIILLMMFFCSIAANADVIAGKNMFLGKEYIVRLSNGDLLSGKLTEFIESDERGEGIRLKTMLGEAVIYESEIKNILTYEENFRHDHRVFIMPTAEPIGNNHFIGAFDLLFFYGGFGITDYFSATIGRTTVPGLYEGQQGFMMNLKSTVYQQYWESMYGKFSLAVGYNLAFLNDDNRFTHLYLASTFRLRRTGFTMDVYYKSGSKDYYELSIQDEFHPFVYEDGTFGLGLGVDTKFSDRHGLYFISELWITDVYDPGQSAATAGLRVANSAFAADFGLALFPSPGIMPYMSFVWTPF